MGFSCVSVLGKNRHNQNRHGSYSQCETPDLTQCSQKPVGSEKAVAHTVNPNSILTKTARQCNPLKALLLRIHRSTQTSALCPARPPSAGALPVVCGQTIEQSSSAVRTILAIREIPHLGDYTAP